MPSFRGFPPETFAFLSDLKANNKRSWFEANRDRYENLWKAPGLDFIEALGPGMAAMEPPMKAEARINGSLRRINRDVRFAADKSPYEPWLHLIFWPGDHPNRGAGMHVVLTPEGLGYGAGRWAFDSPVLARYRERLGDATERAALLAALKEAEGVGCHLDEPHLKRLPKGCDPAPEWDYLLRYKGIVARTMEGGFMPGWIGTPSVVDEMLDRTRRLMPLIGWLHAL
ncbi:DUF2461 domain-containing protein [Defluviimonas sp. WL0024]|uniref:DUF2461 domain-containing protein n=1 Tax=Albidovulum salinarum TaxID=2984153 RepID=A0ABT2X0K6_9RHOB|nr:DUF2461 domain-containing protein [Defluviimonas sp. WL0024]MCU9846849.1 DUF2461 domain-containing protein [Defluviimonas sp. WL0024]